MQICASSGMGHIIEVFTGALYVAYVCSYIGSRAVVALRTLISLLVIWPSYMAHKSPYTYISWNQYFLIWTNASMSNICQWWYLWHFHRKSPSTCSSPLQLIVALGFTSSWFYILTHSHCLSTVNKHLKLNTLIITATIVIIMERSTAKEPEMCKPIQLQWRWIYIELQLNTHIWLQLNATVALYLSDV